MAEKKILYSPPKFPESKLSEEATRTRRNLIAMMAVWALIVLFELTPERIVPLDINLKNSPVSIPTITSFLVIYFWFSFIVYAYKDFARWMHEVRGTISEQNEQINKTVMDFEDGVTAVQRAKNKNIKGIEIKFRSSGNQIGDSLERWESHILAWRRANGQHCRRRRQLWTDVFLRFAWDYVLPTFLILGPAWYFLK